LPISIVGVTGKIYIYTALAITYLDGPETRC